MTPSCEPAGLQDNLSSQDESWWAVALRIEVGHEDLTTSRFALSPLWELTHALRLLAGVTPGPGEPLFRPWLVRARSRYQALARETDVGVILALFAPGWGADFLAPVPATVDTTISDLLDQVRSTPRSRRAVRLARHCAGSRGSIPASSGS
jgi:hypothetical protein